MPTYSPDHAEHWQQFIDTASAKPATSLAQLFINDKNRAAKLSFQAAGLHADFSRQPLDDEALSSLTALANTLQLPRFINGLFAGDIVNTTEQRAALHTALRHDKSDNSPADNNAEYRDAVKQCHSKMRSIVDRLHQQRWTGYSGKHITDIVNIGIGGSDLGPKMACAALTAYHHSAINVHFVSNADQADFLQHVATLCPETTAFIVVSKSWTTQETQLNGERAKNWLLNAGCTPEALKQHFIAITTQVEQALAFGVDEANILPMWDWVGGRFSLWSAVGLAIAIATSFENFEQLLAGAAAMDQHFQHTPLNQNLPFLLAGAEIWNVNVLGRHSQAVVPYSHDLRLLTEHLQQLVMESNGKSINHQGGTINYSTSPIIWGSAGTVGQHSYHQLLHQGTEVVPVDFILPLTSSDSDQTNHNLMIANCLAQAEVLMDGLSADLIEQRLNEQGMEPAQAEQLAPHKAMPGDRPSTLISFEALTPHTLGALIALYEHKVFCCSVFWNINPFDQWGVELGKNVAAKLFAQLSRGDDTDNNPATQASLQTILRTIESRSSKLS